MSDEPIARLHAEISADPSKAEKGLDRFADKLASTAVDASQATDSIADDWQRLGQTLGTLKPFDKLEDQVARIAVTAMQVTSEISDQFGTLRDQLATIKPFDALEDQAAQLAVTVAEATAMVRSDMDTLRAEVSAAQPFDPLAANMREATNAAERELEQLEAKLEAVKVELSSIGVSKADLRGVIDGEGRARDSVLVRRDRQTSYERGQGAQGLAGARRRDATGRYESINENATSGTAAALAADRNAMQELALRARDLYDEEARLLIAINNVNAELGPQAVASSKVSQEARETASALNRQATALSKVSDQYAAATPRAQTYSQLLEELARRERELAGAQADRVGVQKQAGLFPGQRSTAGPSSPQGAGSTEAGARKAEQEAKALAAALLKAELAAASAAQKVAILEREYGQAGKTALEYAQIEAKLATARRQAARDLDRETEALKRQQAAQAKSANSGAMSMDQRVRGVLPRTIDGFSGPAKQFIGDALAMAPAAGIAGVAVLGMGAAIRRAEEGFKLNATLAEAKTNLGVFLDSVERGNRVYDEASAFGRRYGYTQAEIAETTRAATFIFKESVASTEQVMGVLARLATIDPAQGLEGAALSIKELQSGDITSFVKRFEVSRDKALGMRDAIRDGADAIQVMDGFLQSQNVTMAALETRTQGSAGALRSYAQAQEDLTSATGKFAEGPGKFFVSWFATMTNGATALLTNTSDNNQAFAAQAAIAAQSATSLEDYRAKMSQLEQANRGLFYSFSQLTDAQASWLLSVTPAERVLLSNSGAIRSLTQEQLAYLHTLPIARQEQMVAGQAFEQNKVQASELATEIEDLGWHHKISGEMAAQASTYVREFGGLFPQTAAAINVLVLQLKAGTIETDQFNAEMLRLISLSPEVQQAQLDEAAATDAVNLAMVASTAATEAYNVAAANKKVAADAATAADELQTQMLDALNMALYDGTTALDVQAKAALFSAIQHDALAFAQGQASAAAAGAIGSYLSAGGAMTDMALRTLALTDALTALAIVQGKKAVGVTGRGGGAANRARLIELGLDPTEKGARDAVGDAALSAIGDPAKKAALAQAQADAKARSDALNAVTDAQNKVRDAAKTKQQLLADAQRNLAAIKDKTSTAYLEQRTRVLELQADIAGDKPTKTKTPKGAATLQNAVDRNATAGQEVAEQLDYWRNRREALVKGSKAWLDADSKVKALEAKQRKAAASAEKADLTSDLSGASKAEQLTRQYEALAKLTEGTNEYAETLRKIEQLELSVNKARTEAALGEVRDAQARMKEDRELATVQRILSSKTANAEQKQAARLRMEEIRLEREQRGQKIAEDRRDAGMSAQAQPTAAGKQPTPASATGRTTTAPAPAGEGMVTIKPIKPKRGEFFGGAIAGDPYKSAPTGEFRGDAQRGDPYVTRQPQGALAPLAAPSRAALAPAAMPILLASATATGDRTITVNLPPNNINVLVRALLDERDILDRLETQVAGNFQRSFSLNAAGEVSVGGG